MASPKFIIDTNVFFSALYSPNSNAGKLIEFAIEKRIELHAPMEIQIELERNLMKKLNMNEKEITFIINSLPVNWLNQKLYEDYMDQASAIISKKDSPILAAYYLTKFPIITGDKEFFQLEKIKVKSLREVIDEIS